MKLDLHSEDFEITDAIREKVQNHAEEIEDVIPDDGHLEIFFKQETSHVFSVTYRLRCWRKDLVSHVTDADLYHASLQAKKNLQRQLSKLRSQRMRSLRARRGRVFEPIAELY